VIAELAVVSSPDRIERHDGSEGLPGIHAAVLDWYAANGRDLAFRRTTDPWAILVSEVMAQQTQAARAAEHWTRFMAQFPTPAALAAVSPATVIRAWRGLGYNRRAIALRIAAVKIVAEHDGRVPDTLEALEALPGVGPYTARAVLAFAFDLPVAPLDTNIRRVLDRAFGPLPSGRLALQTAADAVVAPAAPAAWSHALMDLGATICGPRQPRCDTCPMRAWCRFATRGGVDARTVPRRKVAARATGPSFASTNRWLRGRILDRLRDTPDGGWAEFDAAMGVHPPSAVRAAVVALAAEGLVSIDEDHRRRARLRTD
jgi:A/G-specific adenine glycosylase